MANSTHFFLSIFVSIILLGSLNSCNINTETSNLIVTEINKSWQFNQVNGDLSGKATVPGVIQTDLLNNGLIEDPFYRTNESDLQWIDKEDWEYTTTFTVDSKTLLKDKITLDFTGLDTYADVYLNDSLILQADNMFRDWNAEVKGILTEGDNSLKVYFHSPIQKALELLEAEGHGYPAPNDQSENGGVGDKKLSVFTRKAGYHYGWDWGPRFVTSGIWRPVYLKAWNAINIENTYIKQNKITPEVAELTADVSIENLNNNQDITVVISTDEVKLTEKNITLEEGISTVSLPFSIENPKLWWSNGLGEPNLYDFDIKILTGNTALAENKVTTGLRDLKLVREKDDAGESFYFELNGVKVFAKGANYIPNDNFLPRVTKADYDKVVADAVNTHMNMLRVWGGGIYENDYFYELCDKNGILIWQDFMLACSMYPGQPEFLESIKQEAIYNVTRLRNHPCIALWCGNNEINGAWSYYKKGGWGWKQRYTKDQQEKLNNIYLKIFHEILPEVVAKNTYNEPYWPSSPQAGMNPEEQANSTSGDVHYWGVWHGLHRFEEFETNTARFFSEYGFQSFPDFETVKTYAIPEDYDIESPVMAAHQRSGIGNLRIKEYMSWYFNVPDNFENFLYMSHVLQAYGMQTGIEAHRRAMPYTMGSLFWQINDCWPVASWSSTDYYHKWKAMQYLVKHAYEKTIISTKLTNNSLAIYGITDNLTKINGTLKLTWITFDGDTINQKEIETEIAANSSSIIYTIDDFKTDIDTTQTVLNIEFSNNDGVIASKLFYFTQPKNLKLPNAEITCNLYKNEGEWFVDITSKQLVKYVYLNIANQNEFFSDNYFDLLPGKTKTISLKDFTPEEETEIDIIHLAIAK